MKIHVLVVDDEKWIADIIEYLLTDEGYKVTVAETGEKALSILQENKVHLVVLDLSLPGIDGLTVCNKIKQNFTIPIIILSARNRESDVISGLEIGAEDYMTKPFNHREFILRVGKIINRMTWLKKQSLIRSDDLSINLNNEEVFINDTRINLTPNEFALLSCLISKAGMVISWQVLLKEVWGKENWEGGRELVKVNIQRLRKKIEPEPRKPIYILNEWGKGYRFKHIEVV